MVGQQLKTSVVNSHAYFKLLTYKGIWYILIYHDLRYLLNAIHITIYREKEKEKQIYIFNKNILHISLSCMTRFFWPIELIDKYII